MEPERWSASSSLYRTVWRWHFYAGLLVLPFLVMMAITGGAYLFKPELDHLVYHAIEDVPARASSFAPLAHVIERVEATVGGRVLELTPAASPTQAVRLTVRVSSGEARTVFADPYDGAVTGNTPYGGVMQLVRKIHSLQRFGFWASCLIELTAGWTILLVGTGLYLWWSRGQGQGGVLTVRGVPRQRVFWRDLHAVTGVLAGAVIFFLAVTGMPWSLFWGDHFQQWATQAHLNRPPAPAAATPAWLMVATMPGMPHAPHAMDHHEPAALPWAMKGAPAPESTRSQDTQITIDEAVRRFGEVGVPRYASIALPGGAAGAFVATLEPARAEDSRVVYLDRHSGQVLGDVGFSLWGPVAKATEWGIAVHQGQEYGSINRYVMLLGCLAIVLMAVAAVTMWWKRRPPGSLGVPPPPSRASAPGFLTIAAFVGVLFPLVGASMLLAWGADRFALVLRRIKET
jgi:uncharacterized iron-regulated membrane protein